MDWELTLWPPDLSAPIAVLYPAGQPISRLSWSVRLWGVGELEMEAPAMGPLVEALAAGQLLGAWLELRRDGEPFWTYIVTRIRIADGLAELEMDMSQHLTAVYVAGQGEGTARIVQVYTVAPTEGAPRSPYRLEAFRDARDTGDVDTYRTRAMEDLRNASLLSALAASGRGGESPTIEVNAHDPGWLLARRIVLPPPGTASDPVPIEGGYVQDVDITGARAHRVVGTPAEVMTAYIQGHMISPADPARSEPRIAVASSLPTGASITHEARFATVLEVCQEVGARALMGWDWRLDRASRAAIFSPRVLEDRTEVVVRSRQPLLAEEYGRFLVGDLVRLEMEALDLAASVRVLGVTWEAQEGEVTPTLRLEMEKQPWGRLLRSPRLMTVAGRM
jgi:hypothetical protein